MKTWLILLGVTIVLGYLKLPLGLCGLAMLIYKILCDLNYIVEIKFNLAAMKKGEVWCFDYVGVYADVSHHFRKMGTFFPKFKLGSNKEDYAPFGVFYDDPRLVDPKKCRAVLGFIRYSKDKNEAFEEYLLKDEGYRKAEFPETSCVRTIVPTKYKSCIIRGILAYYRKLRVVLGSEEFLNQFHINKDKINGVVEIYRKNSIEFNLPLRYQDSFYLFEKDLSEVKYEKTVLGKCTYIYEDFYGNYENLNLIYTDLSQNHQKFQLNENGVNYNMFGIFYDDPDKVGKDKCRGVCGFVRTSESKNEEFEKYMLTEKLNKEVTVGETNVLRTVMSTSNKPTLVSSLKRYYKAIKKNLADDEFIEKYKINREEFNGIIEIYKKDSVELDLPLSNQKEYFLYQKN